MTFTSQVFAVDTIELAGTTETLVRGGRNLFPLLPKALPGVRQISVIGWGSQARAQALNLRDSLAGSDIRVAIGLRPGSTSFPKAEAEGFSRADGTLGDWLDIAAAGDLVLLLISDAALAEHYTSIFAALQPGSTLGLSHGFLAGHLETLGERFREDINVVAVCPKGMGDSVRRLYQQGADINGAGINSSFAVVQDLDGASADRALAWSVGIGSPYTFETTLVSEYRSDLVGERAILIGAVHGIVESLYQHYRLNGDSPEVAFARSAESVTGAISPAISKSGLLAVREALPAGRPVAEFDRAYTATYGTTKDLIEEIYDEVESGNEIRSVVLAGRRLDRTPMTTVSGSPMWKAGAAVRARRTEGSAASDPFTAGVFLAVMVATIDVLAERGHPWSEIVNESIVEAVDSLLPYMHARDIAYMVDNCSVTARLGTRKWGPRFQALLEQVVYPAAEAAADTDPANAIAIKEFVAHPVHEAFTKLATYRPPVDVFVG